ncbi:MAG TPA: TIGR02266 family protein, partial [Polyangiaceae bacterium]|nr:TIGR02266 family protein [Polyangiaceae bacterium]
MVQDTRKDPRAKVLTMTVRYKSATIDEFIEHHSHDVSRGGIFIKTPSPFPPGTLLKFEIRIAEDQAIIGGVGRVVWKREAAQATEERPSGMGVKFLKIDETSRQVIDRIVDTKGDTPSAFEDSDERGEPAADKPAAVSEEPAPIAPMKSKKATMLGLGAVALPSDMEKKEEDKPAEGGFFPKTDSEKEMPPPEERTVMKQAAELLAEALKGAGGSLEEIGAAIEEPKKEAEPPKPSP